MKTVGIIGGMGPEATNHLILKIIKGFEDVGQKNRPSILVDFVTVSIDTESNLILNNDPGDFAELLTNSAKRLEAGGVNFIVIACNSVHVFIEDIRKSVSIPVISVIEEVGKLDLKTSGIIATEFTINNKLFGNTLEIPNFETQESINNIIDSLVKGRVVDLLEIKKLNQLLLSWKKNDIKTCILGCSEMQLLGEIWNKWSKQINFVDTMDVLAKVAVKNLLD